MRQANTGRATHEHRYTFSLLLMCDECHHALTIHRRVNKFRAERRYWSCNYANNQYYRDRQDCTNSAVITEDHARARIQQLIDALLDADNPDTAFDAFLPPHEDFTAEISAAESALEAAKGRARLYIAKQGENPALASLYDDALATTATQITALENSLIALKNRALQHRPTNRRNVIDEIRPIRHEFWTLPEKQINALLLRILGDYRFTVRNGDIVGLIPVPPYKRNK